MEQKKNVEVKENEFILACPKLGRELVCLFSIQKH
jgi:hypothetical protein